MSLLDKIKADLLAYRKNKKAVVDTGTAEQIRDNATTIVVLTTLVGDIETSIKKPGARIGDAEIIALAKARISSIMEVLDKIAEPLKEDFLREAEVYKRYIPAQFTDDQIEAGIRIYLTADPGATLGQIQAMFKKNHAGLYDGKKVSEIFNRVTK